jgi:hypothetical protein
VTAAEQGGTTARCAVHPGRPAVDACPVCRRPRCGPDATTAPGGGCLACRGVARRRFAVSGAERLVRAALAATPVALLGGVVAAQYVGAGLFAYLTPAVVGVLCGAAAQAAAGGPRRGDLALAVRALACLYAVLGVAFGFVLERSVDPLASATLLPYACAVLGVVLWTSPPKVRTGGRRG